MIGGIQAFKQEHLRTWNFLFQPLAGLIMVLAPTTVVLWPDQDHAENKFILCQSGQNADAEQNCQHSENKNNLQLHTNSPLIKAMVMNRNATAHFVNIKAVRILLDNALKCTNDPIRYGDDFIAGYASR
jgi:hypothetical protein